MVEPAAEPASDVPIRELTHHTSQVLARVKAGESLTITERGEPIARVVPLRRRSTRRPAVGYAASGDPTWATRAADELSGFGE
jgi:prevent-host-death family protein